MNAVMTPLEMGVLYMDATGNNHYNSDGLRAVVAKALRDAADEFAAKSANPTEETMPDGDRYVTTQAWLRARADSIEQVQP